MKTFKTASITALVFGFLYLFYNTYMIFSLNPIFKENDIPSLIIGFTMIGISTYLFIMLQKLLNTRFNNTTNDKFIFWIIRLKIASGILSLYLIFSVLSLYFKGVSNLVAQPSNLINGIANIILNVVGQLGIVIFLSVMLFLFGNKLKQVKEKKGRLFFATGVFLMLYGLSLLLATFTVIENDFVAPFIQSLALILMGILFKKYNNPTPLIHDSLDVQNKAVPPIQKIELKDEISITEDLVKKQSEIKSAKNKDDKILDKEDHSRFMPK